MGYLIKKWVHILVMISLVSTAQAKSKKQSTKIMAKPALDYAESIVIPKIECDGASIKDVVKLLQSLIRKHRRSTKKSLFIGVRKASQHPEISIKLNNSTVTEIIQCICWKYELGCVASDNSIVITPPGTSNEAGSFKNRRGTTSFSLNLSISGMEADEVNFESAIYRIGQLARAPSANFVVKQIKSDHPTITAMLSATDIYAAVKHLCLIANYKAEVKHNAILIYPLK